jgi:hypothetical protein
MKEAHMPAKPSGEIKTCTINESQRNCYIYVYERQTLYDPVKKYNVVLTRQVCIAYYNRI